MVTEKYWFKKIQEKMYTIIYMKDYYLVNYVIQKSFWIDITILFWALIICACYGKNQPVIFF